MKKYVKASTRNVFGSEKCYSDMIVDAYVPWEDLDSYMYPEYRLAFQGEKSRIVGKFIGKDGTRYMVLGEMNPSGKILTTTCRVVNFDKYFDIFIASVNGDHKRNEIYVPLLNAGDIITDDVTIDKVAKVEKLDNGQYEVIYQDGSSSTHDSTDTVFLLRR